MYFWFVGTYHVVNGCYTRQEMERGRVAGAVSFCSLLYSVILQTIYMQYIY